MNTLLSHRRVAEVLTSCRSHLPTRLRQYPVSMPGRKRKVLETVCFAPFPVIAERQVVA